MADFFTWSNPNSLEAAAIRNFLDRAQQRVMDSPSRLPIKADQAHLAINWLRALIDLKPSDYTRDAVAELDK